MSSSTSITQEVRERANGRWKILRNALLSASSKRQSAEDATTNHAHSIHRFPGYNMLPTKEMTNETREGLIKHVSSIHVTKFPDQIESALLIQLALSKEDTIAAGTEFRFHCSNTILFNQLDLTGLADSIKSNLHIDVVCEWINSQCLQIRMIRAVPRLHSNLQYPLVVISDTLPTTTTTTTTTSLFIRQRTSQRLTIQELASHQFHQGVDNTGNVCIWDAEKTLAWALIQEYREQQYTSSIKTITELGVGMAGLAALSCAAVFKELQDVYLTDGHVDCVRNNKVNCELMRTQLPTTGSSCNARLHVKQLLWTVDDHIPAETSLRRADWTMVSDCTHFQEYHAALFWTLIQCTKLGGTIWMCQPNRGQSWNRFVQLVEAVNAERDDSLVSIREKQYTTLNAMHQEFLLQAKSCFYDPDIHQPRIFCLQKLREADVHDKQVALQHMIARDPIIGTEK